VQSDLQAARLLQQRGHSLCEQGERSEGLHSLARSLQQLQAIHGLDLNGDQRQQAGEMEYAVRMDLALFARETPQLRGVLSHRGIVRAVAFSPDSHLAMTGGDGFGAWFWDATKGEPVGEPLPHPDEVRAVEFSADGRSVLTAGSDRGRGGARLWDLATRRPLGPLLEFPSPVLSAALHPDGKTILVGRADGAAQLWDGATGRPLGTALSHPEPINAVAFSRDGAYFATGCGGRYVQGHARRWTTRTSEPAGPPLEGGILCRSPSILTADRS
jgi:WD40 repeat protein